MVGRWYYLEQGGVTIDLVPTEVQPPASNGGTSLVILNITLNCAENWLGIVRTLPLLGNVPVWLFGIVCDAPETQSACGLEYAVI